MGKWLTWARVRLSRGVKNAKSLVRNLSSSKSCSHEAYRGMAGWGGSLLPGGLLLRGRRPIRRDGLSGAPVAAPPHRTLVTLSIMLVLCFVLNAKPFMRLDSSDVARSTTPCAETDIPRALTGQDIFNVCYAVTSFLKLNNQSLLLVLGINLHNCIFC